MIVPGPALWAHNMRPDGVVRCYGRCGQRPLRVSGHYGITDTRLPLKPFDFNRSAPCFARCHFVPAVQNPSAMHKLHQRKQVFGCRLSYERQRASGAIKCFLKHFIDVPYHAVPFSPLPVDCGFRICGLLRILFSSTGGLWKTRDDPQNPVEKISRK